MARSNAAETKCDVCGMEALPDQAFTRDGVPFYQRRRCPSCHAKLNRQVLQGLVCVAVAMGLTGFLLIWKSPDSLFGRLLLNLFWFDLLLYLSIVPHEFAHAIAGRLAGFRITGISIGNGMTLFRVRLTQVPVTIKAIPFGGFTQGQSKQLTYVRARMFAFIAAGPAVNLLIALGVWTLTASGPSLTLSSNILNILVAANLLIAIENLAPFRSTSDGQTRDSDGLALLKLLLPARLSAQPARGGNPPVWIRVMRICGALFLLVLTLACAALTIWMSIQLLRENNGHLLWFMVTVFGLITLSLGWFSWRAFSHKPQSAPAAGTHANIVAIANRELSGAGSPHLAKRLAALNQELARLTSGKERDTATARIDAALHELGDLPVLLNVKATVLTQQDRFKEAYETYHKLLTREELRSETRAVVSTAALTALLRAGEVDRFRAELRETLAHQTTLEKLFILDCMASLAVFGTTSIPLPDALACINEALLLQPGNLTLRATRGCLLFETGDLENSERELSEVFQLSESLTDKALTSFYLALAYKRRGHEREAASMARRAVRFARMPVMLKRLAEEFPGIDFE